MKLKYGAEMRKLNLIILMCEIFLNNLLNLITPVTINAIKGYLIYLAHIDPTLSS